MSLAVWRLAVDMESARRIVSRSIHSTFWCNFSEGRLAVSKLAPTVAPSMMASHVMVEPVVKTTARSIKLDLANQIGDDAAPTNDAVPVNVAVRHRR